MYNANVTKEYTLDGTTVKATLRRISMEEALGIQSAGTTAEKASSTMAALRKNLVSVEGLPEGVTKETLFSEFYFSSLIQRLVQDMMATGEIGEDDARPFGKR